MPAEMALQLPLGGSSDGRGAGDGSVLGRLSGLLRNGLGLGLLGGLGLLRRLRSLLGGALSGLVLGLVGGLLSSLALVLDGSTELGEGVGALGLLSIGRSGTLLNSSGAGGVGLGLLAEGEGEGRLALVGLDVLLLAVNGRGSGLSGLGGHVGRAGDLSAQGLDGVGLGDDRGILFAIDVSNWGLVESVTCCMGLPRRREECPWPGWRGQPPQASSCRTTGHRRGCKHVSNAILVTTPAVLVHDIPGALGRSGLLSSLALGLLSGGLGSGSGLRLLGSLGGSLSGLGGGGGLGGSTLGRGLSDGLLLLVLGLDILSSGRLALLVTAEESTEDGGALPAGGALALILLGVSTLLLGLLLGLALGGLSGGGSLSGGSALSGGSLLSGLGGLSLGLLVLSLLLLLLFLLLLLLDGGREGSEGGLVLLRLGDGLGELLSLGDPQLDLADPVVALGGAASLEGVLVSLGGQDELVGALGGRLGSIVLEVRSAG